MGHLERGGGTHSSSQVFACWSFSEITPGIFSSSLFLYIQTRIYWDSPPSEWTFTFLPRPCSTVPKRPLIQQCAWPEALCEDMAFLCVSNAQASPGGAGGRVRKKKVQTRTKKTGPFYPPQRSSQPVPWWKNQCDLRYQPSVWTDVVSEQDSAA